VPENVILPEQLMVPVEIETIHFNAADAPPGIAILEHVSVPAPTANVEAAAVDVVKITAPVESVTPLLILRELAVEAAFNVILEQVVVAVQVILAPATITITSVPRPVGAVPPCQLVPTFQLPVTALLV